MSHIGVMPYKCTLCEKSFALPSWLLKHGVIHTGEKPYKCTECGKTFVQSSNLLQHTRIHTGEKSYTCTVCEKSFSLTSRLASHMKTHTGEKPYKCTECGKSFAQSSWLLKHAMVHTGKKHYKCTKCGKPFSQSSHLFQHRRIHTGENLYNCTMSDKTDLAKCSCGVAFIRLETGRCENIPLDNRPCPICKLHVKTEIHVITQCPSYQTLRNVLYNRAKEINENFENMNDVNKTIFVLSNEEIIKLSTKTLFQILK